MALALEQHVEAAVDQAFLVHARADTHLVQQVHGDLFQNAGANTAQHVVAALALHDDGVDTGLVQQLAEQQAGGAGADDSDLGTHGVLLVEKRCVKNRQARAIHGA